MLTSEPPWETAPNWANYRGRTHFGKWAWFQDRPIAELSGGQTAIGWREFGLLQFSLLECSTENWQDSLEKRPDSD